MASHAEADELRARTPTAEEAAHAAVTVQADKERRAIEESTRNPHEWKSPKSKKKVWERAPVPLKSTEEYTSSPKVRLREDGPRWREYHRDGNSTSSIGGARPVGVGHTWEPSTSYYPSRDRPVVGAIIGEETDGADADSRSRKIANRKKGQRKVTSALSKAGGNVLRQALSGTPPKRQSNRTHPRDYYKQSKMSSEQQAVQQLIDPPDSFRENYPPLPVARAAPAQQQRQQQQQSVFVRDMPAVMPAELPQQQMERRDRRDGHEAGYLGQRSRTVAAASRMQTGGRETEGGGYAQQYQQRRRARGVKPSDGGSAGGGPHVTLDRSRMRKMTYGMDSAMMQSPQVGSVRTRILDVSYQ